MSKFSLKKIISTARVEYMKWICNARMILIAILLIFIYKIITVPLLEHAEEMNSPINILEPFIATVNSELLTVIIPAVFLVLFSDFPKSDGNTLFFLQRTGKLNWLFGQILFSIMAIFTYVIVIFCGSIIPVILKGFWANGWSLVVTDYISLFPEKSQSFASLLIRKNIYNQVSPWYAAFMGYGLIMLYLMVLSLVLLIYNSVGKKVFGILTDGGIIAFGGAFCIIKMKVMWLLPMAHISIWLHYTEYFREEVMSMRNTFIYFVVIILLLVYFSLFTIKRMNIDSVQDVD